MFTATFLTLLYLHLGYQIGKKGWKVWKKKDSRSKKSMLFFPISRRNRRVGKGNFLMDGADSDEIGYKVMMTFGWLPLMAFNLAVIGLAIGPEMLLSRLLAKRPSLAQRNARLALAARNMDRGLEREFKALEASAPPALPDAPAAPQEEAPAKDAAPAPTAARHRKQKRRGGRRARARAEPVTVRVEIGVTDDRKAASSDAANGGAARDDPFQAPRARRQGPDIH